jgi:hypothetical protein
MRHPTSTVIIRVPLADLERLAEVRARWARAHGDVPASWHCDEPAREVAAFLVAVAIEHAVQLYASLISDRAALGNPPDPAQVTLIELLAEDSECAPS